VEEGNSVRNEETTFSAVAVEMSRIVILELGREAKNFTPARPIPDAPPEALWSVCIHEGGGRRDGPVTMTLFPARFEIAIIAELLEETTNWR
jgi:hypothetical protein